jgi:Fur family ferric uptake transcriptional regulator
VSELTVVAAKELLKCAGLRGTAARIAVLQCLAKARSPLSHAEVTRRLREFGFDPSTVFRSLTELAEAEMFYRLDLGDGARRFEFGLSGGGNAPGHAHFVCLACGKITCLTDADSELLTFSQTAVHPGRVTEVLLKGYCPTCDEGLTANSRVLT